MTSPSYTNRTPVMLTGSQVCSDCRAMFLQQFILILGSLQLVCTVCVQIDAHAELDSVAGRWDAGLISCDQPHACRQLDHLVSFYCQLC